MIILIITGAAHWGNQRTGEDKKSFESPGSTRDTAAALNAQVYEILFQTNINGEQKKEIGILSRRLASAKQDFEEQVSSFKKWEEVAFWLWLGEPIPAAAWAEGEQGGQIGSPGKDKDDQKMLPHLFSFET